MSDIVIQTGVDKLLSLVKQKKRVSFSEAAKTLGVSKEIIEEWADFLEEEAIISIEYKFTTSYLVERKISGQELKAKAKDFSDKKDAFIRKVESSIASIDSEGEGLSKFKEDFNNLQKHIQKEIDSVKSELEELEKYEGLKKNINKDMIRQQESFRKSIEETHKELENEERRYRAIFKQIDLEKAHLEAEKRKTDEIELQEKSLKERLKAINELINVIHKKMKSEEDETERSRAHIIKLQKLVDKVRANIEAKKKKIDELIADGKRQEDKILAIQQQVIKKIKKSKTVLDKDHKSKKEIIDDFKVFFEKKNTINKLLHDLDTKRSDLKAELQKLIRKAKAFDLASKSSNVKKHIKELESNFNALDKKRAAFKAQIKRLVTLIKK